MKTFALLLALFLPLPGWALVKPATVITIEDFDTLWKDGSAWSFANGPEFPGAKGSFDRTKTTARSGKYAGKLAFDFTGGGTYVQAALQTPASPFLKSIKLWIKSPVETRLTFRYTDQTGQTLQKSFNVPVEEWTEQTITISGFQGYWGGANDGKIHGAPKAIAFLAENTGLKTGAVYLDDIRLVKSETGEAPINQNSETVAATFGKGDDWRLDGKGAGGKSSYANGVLTYDFTQGAASIGVVPPDRSLPGSPVRFRIQAKGNAAGHPVRLIIYTHFMTFEKSLGMFAPTNIDGLFEAVTDAPPGPGWKWYNGENDGKRHGPLRLGGIYLDAGEKKDAGEITLKELRVTAEFPPDQAILALARTEITPTTGLGLRAAKYILSARNLMTKPLKATVHWSIRNWNGDTLKNGSNEMLLPALGVPAEMSVSDELRTFGEAQFQIEAEEQQVPILQTYAMPNLSLKFQSGANPASPFGMGLYLYRYSNEPQSLKDMETAAQMAQNIGVKWSREEMNWGRIEQQKGQYDWSFYDNMIATAKKHGISIYGIISFWAGWTKPYTEEGIADYCRYTKDLVNRYKKDIHHWEVWNEPNIFFWQGPKDMYADLLKRAYATIKEADPTASVLGCSTAGIDLNFIKRMQELKAPFDILTIHPYRAELNDINFVDELKQVAELVKREDGTRRDVWITEMGWGTHLPHNSMASDFAVTSQRRQATLIARSYIDAIASGVCGSISWYDFRNDGNDPFNFEHNMGIVTQDFHPKPAMYAYRTVTRMLEGKHIEKRLQMNEGIVAWRFAGQNGTGPVLALWSSRKDRTIELPSKINAITTNLMGEETKVTPAGGKIKLRLQVDTPVFVTF